MNILTLHGLNNNWVRPIDWPNFRWQVELARDWGATHVALPSLSKKLVLSDLSIVLKAIRIIEEDYGLKTIIWIDRMVSLTPVLWDSLLLPFLEKTAYEENRIVELAREADKCSRPMEEVIDRLWMCKNKLLEHGVISGTQIMLGGITMQGTMELDRISPAYLTHTLIHSVGNYPKYSPYAPTGMGFAQLRHDLLDLKLGIAPSRNLVIQDVGWSDFRPFNPDFRNYEVISQIIGDTIAIVKDLDIYGMGIWCLSDQHHNEEPYEKQHGLVDYTTGLPKPGVEELMESWL